MINDHPSRVFTIINNHTRLMLELATGYKLCGDQVKKHEDGEDSRCQY